MLVRQEMHECIQMAMACVSFVYRLFGLVSAQCVMLDSSNLVLMKVQQACSVHH